MTTTEMPEDFSVAIQKRFAVEPGTSEWKTVLRTWDFYQELKRTWAAERQALRRVERKAVNGSPGYGRRMVGRKGQRKSVPDPAGMALMDAINRWHEDERLSFRAIRRRLLERGLLVRGRKPSLSWVHRAYCSSVARQVEKATSGPDGGQGDPGKSRSTEGCPEPEGLEPGVCQQEIRGV